MPASARQGCMRGEPKARGKGRKGLQVTCPREYRQGFLVLVSTQEGKWDQAESLTIHRPCDSEMALAQPHRYTA